MSEYITQLPQTAEEITDPEPIIQKYEQYSSDLYLQLLKDNTASKIYLYAILDFCKNILSYEALPVKDNSPDLYYLVNAIQKILQQYSGLLKYTDLYTEQCKVMIDTDDTKYLKSYLLFVKNCVEQYLIPLLTLASELENENYQLKLATYTYLLENDYSIIEQYTENKYFTFNLVAVQNARMYRYRDDTIIAINDSITVTNIIKTVWFYIYLTYLAYKNDKDRDFTLFDKLKELIEDFLNRQDYNILDRILDILGKLELDDTTDKNKSEIISAINDANKTILSNRINSYPELLDYLKDYMDSLNSFLKKLQISPDYDKIQSVLDSLTKLVNRLTEWLPSGALGAEQIAKINKMIETVNQTIQTFNAVLCTIRQLLCVIGGYINFKDTVATPLLNQASKLIKQSSQALETLESAFTIQLTTMNNVIRDSVFELAKVKCLAKSYQVSVASGQSTDTNWTAIYTAAVETAVTGEASDSLLQSMLGSAKSYVNDIKAQYENALSSKSSVNCSPIVSPNLNIKQPNTKKVYVPGLSEIKLKVSC